MESRKDDFEPHPVKEQLPGVDFCLTSPPNWPEAMFLGFQHYLVMLGTTVLIPTILVPQMGGDDEDKAKVIQTFLFVSGINTLLQTYFGTRLPTVMGGSYTYIIPTLSVILSERCSSTSDPHEKFKCSMRATQGAFIAASCLQIIFGFSGLWRIVMRFISPLSALPIVTLSGLGLYFIGFPSMAKCVEIGLPALILFVFFSQYLPCIVEGRRTFFLRSSVVISILIVWMYAYILTVGGVYKHSSSKTQNHCRTDRSGLVAGSPWIRIPYPFQWGAPTFDAADTFAIMSASFASLIESTGTFKAVSRYASATCVPPAVMSRGIGVGGNKTCGLTKGIGILLAGIFGTGNGSAPLTENAGLIATTRVGSRMVIQISAGFMIFFSILGKFGAFFSSIPFTIFAALYCVFFAFVASAGLGFLQYCNLNSFRTKFILGFSLFLGLSIPQYFKEFSYSSGHGPVHTHARWFNHSLNVIFSSPATVAGIVAVMLDITLHHGDPSIRRDSGMHWWERFRNFSTDPRSEEFYSLPFNLNKYFPPI